MAGETGSTFTCKCGKTQGWIYEGVPVAVGIFIAILLAIYGVGAFVMWQWNPRWWDLGARLVVAFAGVTFGAIGGGVYILYRNYEP